MVKTIDNKTKLSKISLSVTKISKFKIEPNERAYGNEPRGNPKSNR